MKNLEDLSKQRRLFVHVQWPESQVIEEQWWFQKYGFHLDNGEVMASVDWYTRYKNGEDMTHKYSSIEEAQEDFDVLDDEDFFENKSGFRRPELITYL